MRASFWVIGPLLARMGEAKVSLPGGCAIGTRPVDLFLEGLQALGAEIESTTAMSSPRPEGRPRRQPLRVPEGLGRRDPCADDGGDAGQAARPCSENAAREPEVVNLAECLNAMGAKITGAGTRDHHHRRRRHRCRARAIAVIPDRIETGTYAMAVAMAGGDVMLRRRARRPARRPRST